MTSATAISLPMRLPIRKLVWLGVGVLPFLFIIVANYFVRASPSAGDPWQIRSAAFIKSDVGAANELPATGWREVSLPHFYLDRQTGPYVVWYRFDVNVRSDSDSLWAV